MINYLSVKNKLLSALFIYLFIPFNPLLAKEARDYILIDKAVMSCYKHKKYCNKALLKIHSYQKNAGENKKFSCQTRLLGLEANIIMARNFNLKKKEARSIIDSIKKYC